MVLRTEEAEIGRKQFFIRGTEIMMLCHAAGHENQQEVMLDRKACSCTKGRYDIFGCPIGCTFPSFPFSMLVLPSSYPILLPYFLSEGAVHIVVGDGEHEKRVCLSAGILCRDTSLYANTSSITISALVFVFISQGSFPSLHRSFSSAHLSVCQEVSRWIEAC